MMANQNQKRAFRHMTVKSKLYLNFSEECYFKDFRNILFWTIREVCFPVHLRRLIARKLQYVPKCTELSHSLVEIDQQTFSTLFTA